MRNRLVFAYESTRDDDDLIEDVKDFLDATSEGEWELVSWSTNQGIVVVVNAPLECRTMHLEPVLEMEFIPLSSAMDEMDDRDNEWIEPEPSEDTSPLGEAQEMTQRWMEAMFDDSNVPEPTPPPPPPEDKPRRSARKRRQASAEAPAKKRRASDDVPTGRNPDKRGSRKPPRDEAVAEPVEDATAKIEPDPEPERPNRKAAPAEQRAGADDLMAKFGLKGTLKGSEAFSEMFVFNDDGGQEEVQRG